MPMPINYRNYHPDWKDIIRPRILKRDNYKCRVCGVGNRMRIVRNSDEEWLEVDDIIEKESVRTGQPMIRVVLNISHLNHIVTDNRDENLRSMCQLHHIRHDAKHKKAMAIIGKVWDPALAIKMALEPDGEKYLPHLFVITRARRNQLAQLITIRKKREHYGTYSTYDKELSLLIDRTMTEYKDLLKTSCGILSDKYGIKDSEGFMHDYWSSDLKFISADKAVKFYANPDEI